MTINGRSACNYTGRPIHCPSPTIPPLPFNPGLLSPPPPSPTPPATMATTSTTRNLFAGLPPPAECLAILVGVAELTLFGLGGLANTTEFAKGYGLPLPSAAASQTHPGALEAGTAKDKSESEAVHRTQSALVAAIAARNIQNGIVILTFACYWRDRRALGTVLLGSFVTTLADLLLVKWYGAQEAVFGHVIGVLNTSCIGGALLYWSRDDKLW